MNSPHGVDHSGLDRFLTIIPNTVFITLPGEQYEQVRVGQHYQSTSECRLIDETQHAKSEAADMRHNLDSDCYAPGGANAQEVKEEPALEPKRECVPIS